jgi:glycine oxidase
LAVESNPRRVLGVRTREGFIAAASVINAAGAWAGELRGVPLPAQVAVKPVKGQMLALAMPKGFLHRVVWAPGVYLIPRQDGRLVVGATVEDVGFDQRVTAGAVANLLQAALAALPGAATFALSETWTGHRPATPDGEVLLGATALDGYFVACGHYRNGILLAPITGRRIADIVLGPTTASSAPQEPESLGDAPKFAACP